ncbi:MAG TPA: hypothetical protein VKZ68_03330 [Ohtaekwangia sp.]|nr:hypothetical protein [Ohtaekwangia sp.]
MLTVTGFVRIRDYKVSRDGEVLTQPDVQGEPEKFLQRVYESAGIDYPRFYKMDNLSGAGFLAAEILINKYAINKFQADAKGVILTNANASLDTDKRYLEAIKRAPSPAIFVYTLPNIAAGEICIRHGIKGENAFFITDEFDPGLLVSYVEEAFKVSEMNTCVTGWVDVVEHHHDVLLYLVEREPRGMALPHTIEQVSKLYSQVLWNS